MALNILTGFLIGICASFPLGPAALIVLRNALKGGRRAGFLTGLGVTTVDSTFAIAALFALAWVQGLMAAHERWVLVIGGAIVAVIGAVLLLRVKSPADNLPPDPDEGFSVKDYLQAVAVGYSNPGAILIMFGLFAFFGVDTQQSVLRLAPVILALSLGSACYWFSFSTAFGKVGRSLSPLSVRRISRIAGGCIILLGIILIIKGILIAS